MGDLKGLQGENDSDFTSKCRQPFDLTVEWLVSTSDQHFKSMVASFSFASTDKEQNMTQRSNNVPRQADLGSNLLPQRAKSQCFRYKQQAEKRFNHSHRLRLFSTRRTKSVTQQ